MNKSEQWLNQREATIPQTEMLRERENYRDKESTDEKMIESHGASVLTSAAQGLQAD